MERSLPKKLFVVCTETSSDLLAGRLVAELKHTVPELTLSGVGGSQLMAQGMVPTYQVRDFNVMGLVEVVSQLKRLKAMFNHLVQQIREQRPDALLLVDGPDFNLRLAKAVKDLGIPVLYYVSPQVWAWRKGRARQIAELVDHILLLFSFETKIYKPLGLPHTWVGHPLVDELKSLGNREEFFSEHGLDLQKPLVALAPGSRKSVVRKLLPVMAEVARARAGRFQFALPLAHTIDEAYVAELLNDAPVAVLPGQMRSLMCHSQAAVVASGTATLETGLLRTPMIVGYRLKKSTFLLANLMVRIPHIALVNIVLQKRVVPELVQGQFQVDKIVPLLDDLVSDSGKRARMIAEFDRLEGILGGGGASQRAAAVVRDYLFR